MNGREALQVVQMLNAFWTQNPIPPEAGVTWSTVLVDRDYGRISAAIASLATRSKWRPSLAEILEAANPPKPKEVAADFERVLSTVRIHPPGQRDDKVAPDVREAVRRLGGWGAVGRWQLDERNWRERDFARVLGEVQESNEAKVLEAKRSQLELGDGS